MQKRVNVLFVVVMMGMLLLTGCTQDGNNNSQGGSAESTQGQVFSDGEVSAAREAIEKDYAVLSISLQSLERNEAMDAAEEFVTLATEQYGANNVIMFDAIAEDAPEELRHMILVRESADAEWSVMCEIIDKPQAVEGVVEADTTTDENTETNRIETEK